MVVPSRLRTVASPRTMRPTRGARSGAPSTSSTDGPAAGGAVAARIVGAAATPTRPRARTTTATRRAPKERIERPSAMTPGASGGPEDGPRRSPMGPSIAVDCFIGHHDGAQIGRLPGKTSRAPNRPKGPSRSEIGINRPCVVTSSSPSPRSSSPGGTSSPGRTLSQITRTPVPAGAVLPAVAVPSSRAEATFPTAAVPTPDPTPTPTRPTRRSRSRRAQSRSWRPRAAQTVRWRPIRACSEAIAGRWPTARSPAVRTYPWGAWLVDGERFHDGLDIASFCGDTVVAAHDGRSSRPAGSSTRSSAGSATWGPTSAGSTG